jgi:hypothetical protein
VERKVLASLGYRRKLAMSLFELADFVVNLLINACLQVGLAGRADDDHGVWKGFVTGKR